MDPKFYKEYYDLERNHWWFTARLSILESLLHRLVLKNQNAPLKILNAGVATGATSEMLNKYGEVTSLEYDKECCEFLEEKTGIKPVHGSLTALPFQDQEFDLVCAFDVIEHIEDDVLACQEIARVLKSDGQYYITVPAYTFLWSNHDVINHHFRRYTRKTLLESLNNGNLTNTHSTYFNFLLFLPIALMRLSQMLIPKSKERQSSGSDNEMFQSSNFISKTLRSIFLSEKAILDRRMKLPFGISFLSIGTRK